MSTQKSGSTALMEISIIATVWLKLSNLYLELLSSGCCETIRHTATWAMLLEPGRTLLCASVSRVHIRLE